MKTMMLADFLALAKSLPKNVALWALLATGICLVAGNATPIILLTGFPMSHMVLMPMLLRDQRRDWGRLSPGFAGFREANVVAGRYASIAIVVAGCVALGVAAYTTACIVNAVVPGLPLVRHFAVGFDAAGVVSFAAGTFALTIAMFSVLLPFMFADSHRKLASYIPFAFMLALMGWIYAFRSMNFDAFFPSWVGSSSPRSRWAARSSWEDASRRRRSPCTSYRSARRFAGTRRATSSPSEPDRPASRCPRNPRWPGRAHARN